MAAVMTLILHPLRLMGRHAPLVMAAGVFCGLLLPGLAAVLRPFLPAAVVLLLFVAMLRIDWTAVAGLAMAPRPLVVALLLLFVAAPTLVTALLAITEPWFALPSGLAAAVVLMAATAPIGSSANFAYLLRLDGGFALVVALLATFAVPLLTPPLAATLAGVALAIPAAELMLRLAFIVGSALVLSLIVRRLVGVERIRAHGELCDAAAAIALVLFAIAIMDGVGAVVLAQPGHAALHLAVAFAANFGLQGLTALAALALPARFSCLSRDRALTLGLLSGNRNMGLLLAALPAGSDTDILLFFALAQFPMYFTPLVLGPIYRWMRD